jgi:anti-anti-sigma factor
MGATKKREKKKIIKPSQDIVASMAKEFKLELRKHINKSPKELIIDMTGVKIIDSIGLGVIISAYNSLKEIGGKLFISNVSDDILDLFRLMRLDNLFEIK